MRRWRHRRMAVAVALAMLGAPAARADACDGGPDPAGASVAARIAAIACAEHELWYSPFIDTEGRLASMTVAEAESSTLRDARTPAWRRVAEYWQSTGLITAMGGFDGAADCAGMLDSRPAVVSCRGFLVDTPWSAVFVSYVLTRAGVAGFRPSVRHVDYVRDAYGNEGGGPYRLDDPATASPAVGDLLCFVRMPPTTFGHDGLRRWLARPFARALAMHCDIVVAIEPGRAHLVGGNVLQGVTRRILPLNRQGRLWGLAQRVGPGPRCDPAHPAGCDFNRQDWAALLRLDPAIARSTAPGPPAVPASRCCIACPLPMPPDLRRCRADEPRPVAPGASGSVTEPGPPSAQERP